MAVAQRLSEQEYLDFVLSHPDGQWELHDGVLVEKPGMSWNHGAIVRRLIVALDRQLDEADYQVFTELRVRRPEASVLQPDLMVVPTSYGGGFVDRPILAIFSDPVPLVVEVWSPSTGARDIDTKIPVYMQRGDLEIWRIHPFERTLTRWARQPDGSYEETLHRGGVISPVALPWVTVDLDQLLAL